MIQSPTSQYPQGITPAAQQPVQLAAPQVAQPAPQAQAAPQAYYNYPSSNFYQYPQTCSAQPQYNAVKIDIINPQAFPGMAPQQAAPAAPAYPMMPAQFMPAAPVVNQIAQAPAQAPVPPAPVITEEAPAAAPAAPAPEAAAPAAPATPAEAPKVAEPQAQAPAVDVQSFKQRLTAENLEDQSKAIEEIAELTQNNPAAATALLDTQIMEGLLGVIAKDTTTLAGPSPKQLELRQQIIAGKELTDADKAEANTITPMETAERNKQYALYTIAFLQNLLSSEVEKRNGVKLDIKDLPGIEQVVQTAKADPNPLLRVSALASLSHIAKPEYQPVLSQIFELAKSDADVNVQEAAKKAADQLATLGAQPAAAPAEAPKA